jgi:hypothetical protein
VPPDASSIEGPVEKVCFQLSFVGSNWEVGSGLIAGAPWGAFNEDPLERMTDFLVFLTRA